MTTPVAPALIAWHAVHGRHGLPWQRERTPYRVWISEVMLQQTQVATVIPYFERFMLRFPDVRALAMAPIDEVLHHWTGLGYYARARNLHRAAQRIVAEHAAALPLEFAALADLPGIGRSTAGAILALATGARHAILDGNVKRVLARRFGIEGSPATRAGDHEFWSRAEAETPLADVATYTQAIMDLGATVCVRRNPTCERCPLVADCVAHRDGREHELPARRAKSVDRARKRRCREVVMLIARRDDGAVMLERRPPQGIWGGLWCLPEFDTEDDARRYATLALNGSRFDAVPLAPVPHAFSHFDLLITPLVARCRGDGAVADSDARLWYDSRTPARVGLPAPVVAILGKLS